MAPLNPRVSLQTSNTCFVNLAQISLILLLHVSVLGWSWGDSLVSRNKEGNKLYKEGRIDEALSKWRDAQIEDPDSDKLHYNIGNGLHGQKKYEDALKEYEKSLNSKDNELQRDAYYNIGNTQYRMGKLLEAIESYKKCLDINPDDEDAKYNIEFVRKKIKENLKKEDRKQKESQQKDDNAGEQKERGESSQAQEDQQKEKEAQAAQESEEDKEKQAKEEQEKQTVEEKEKSEGRKDEENPSGEEKKGEMSKEDAMRLLDALKDDEKDTQKELRNHPGEGSYRVEKDW